jgi:MFS family permease
MDEVGAMEQAVFGGDNRKWWTLAAVSLGLFMIMLDNTVVNVALPSIQHDLGLSLSELEWVVAGYALTFAALMLTGGKLADLLGRRLMFVTGLVIFTAASLACGLAGGAEVLIGARVVQGVGAALMNPASSRSSPPPSRRGNAARRSASGPASPRSRSRSGRSSAASSPSTSTGAGSSS